MSNIHVRSAGADLADRDTDSRSNGVELVCARSNQERRGRRGPDLKQRVFGFCTDRQSEVQISIIDSETAARS